MDNKKLLGKRIKEIRKLKNYTQEELAEIVNLETSSLSGIESGRFFPSLHVLDKLSQALNVELVEFFYFSTVNIPKNLDDEIIRIIASQSSQNKVIILDCCHSGYVGAIDTSRQLTATINEGVTILTASKFDESAAEINGHGVFTELLTEALKGGAADITGNISPGSIYAYIDRALGPWEQRPVFKTNVKRFISLRNVTAPIDINIVRRITDYFDEPTTKLPLNPSYEPTNNTETEHKVIKPYSIDKNVAIFSDLQKLESVGLVVPDGTPHMYYAAMESKACKLTSVGQHYWRLVKENRI